jgi:apolipoprotein D and lipocalin family protein
MHGYVVPDTGNARWRESPLWPIYLSYLILWVDPDYQYALVGYPGRGYGWVLSRSSTMDDATYRGLLARFGAEGYDTSLFQRVPQAP